VGTTFLSDLEDDLLADDRHHSPKTQKSSLRMATVFLQTLLIALQPDGYCAHKPVFRGKGKVIPPCFLLITLP
jgi:hypothetical protein